MKSESARPSRGRPRLSNHHPSQPAEKEILAHAARLFALKGFASTTTREIAAAAGLRQPSLFHYFPNKEALLHTLCDVAMSEPLRRIEAIRRRRRDPAARLFEALYFYANYLLSQGYDLSSLGQSPELRSAPFERWHRKRDRIRSIIADLVRSGQKSGQFVESSVPITAQVLLTLCESPVEWFRPGDRLTSSALALELVRFGLRGILAKPSEFDLGDPSKLANQDRAKTGRS